MSKELIEKVVCVIGQIQNSKTDKDKAKEIISLCADEAIASANSVLSAMAYGTPDSPPNRMRELINKEIEKRMK